MNNSPATRLATLRKQTMAEFIPLEKRLYKYFWHPFKLPAFTRTVMQDVADGYWFGLLKPDGKHHEGIVAKLKAIRAREDVSESIRDQAALALRSISEAIARELDKQDNKGEGNDL